MNDIKLLDGTTLEIKVNFLTIKLIKDLGIEKKMDALRKNPKNTNLEFDIVAKMIYAIIRSNGRKIDEEEALALIPLDIDEIKKLMQQFHEECDDFKKKQEQKKRK